MHHDPDGLSIPSIDEWSKRRRRPTVGVYNHRSAPINPRPQVSDRASGAQRFTCLDRNSDGVTPSLIDVAEDLVGKVMCVHRHF
jgi:hypothetical protein